MLAQIEYKIPKDLSEATEILTKDKAKILAGGTDLIIQIREKQIKLETIVDLSQIKDIKEITVKNNRLCIGAMASFTAIGESALVKEHFPILAEAAKSVGSPQIRNTATVGGNIVNGATAADSVPALIVLEAELRLFSKNNEKKVPLNGFITGLNKTAIEAGEVLYSIEIPLKAERQMAFVKLGRRKALAISRINIAVVLELDGEKNVASAKIALGAVGTTAYRVTQVEEFLVGRPLDKETIAKAKEIINQVVKDKLGNRSTVAYKSRIASAVLGKALWKIADPKGGECNE